MPNTETERNLLRPGLRLTYDFIARNADKLSHGLLEVTIIAADGASVCLSRRFYLTPAQGGPLTRNYRQDSVEELSARDPFFLPRRRQAELQEQNPWQEPAAGCRIMARSETLALNGENRAATHIWRKSKDEEVSRHYDCATGQLLHWKESRGGAETMARLMGSRQMDLPWSDAPLPACLHQTQALIYSGYSALQAPGAAPAPLARRQELRVIRRGDGWLFLESRMHRQESPAVADSLVVNGPGSSPPLGIAPDILRRLQAGQVVDRDPYTGFMLLVAGRDAKAATFAEEGPAQSFRYVFDLNSGMLACVASEDRSTGYGAIASEMRLV